MEEEEEEAIPSRKGNETALERENIQSSLSR